MRRDKSAPPSTVADLAILGRVLDEHRPRLVAAVRRRLDPALATRIDPEEVVHEAFLVARRRWPGYREAEAVSAYAWLYRLARDCLIEAWRRETRGRRDVHRDLPWPEASSVQLGLGLLSPGTSPSAAAAREELRERMRQALDLLRESDREILWMRHYDDLTFPEAAMVLGITENTAAVRYVRALRRLKELWQRLYPRGGPDHE
jgi:RNA polymerase sigma-70 factor (ECF subfamily)